MKHRNDSISAELKKLKDNPIVITKVKTVIKIKEVPMNSDSVNHNQKDSTYTLSWSADRQPYFSMRGSTWVKNDFSQFKTTLHDMTMNAMLTVDLVEENKTGIRVLARTDNPYIVIDDVQGAFIDPTKSNVIKSYFKPKRWGIGLQGGIGVCGDLKIRPYIGVGISWSLIQF